MPLTEFRLEVGLPVWRYDVGGVVVEKRLLMPHGQNTVHVLYELKSAVPTLRGSTSRSRFITARTTSPSARRSPSVDRSSEPRYGYELGFAALPPLKFMVDGAHAEYTERQATWPDRRYAVEESRGYMDTAGAWTPGVFTLDLAATPLRNVHRIDGAVGGRYGAAKAPRRSRPSASAASSASRPPIPARAHGLAAELVLAADQFIVTPVGRTAEAARVRARGDEERSVIAGYHWFTDWGRDTMISLEGLTLLTGRTAEAKGILRTFTSCDSRRPAAEPVSRGR